MIHQRCCLVFSLRTGAFLAAIVYFLSVLFDVYLTHCSVIYDTDGEKTVIILKSFFLVISGILLIIGATKEDRVCVITSVSFSTAGCVAEILGILIIKGIKEVFTAKIQVWLMIILMVEHYIFIIMIEMGIYLLREIKEKHAPLRDMAQTNNDLAPSMMISNPFGI